MKTSLYERVCWGEGFLSLEGDSPIDESIEAVDPFCLEYRTRKESELGNWDRKVIHVRERMK